MTNGERARAIRAEITKAEASLAQVDALATDEFRDGLDADRRAKAETALARAVKAVNAAHNAMLAAGKSSGDVTVQSGGGGGK